MTTMNSWPMDIANAQVRSTSFMALAYTSTTSISMEIATISQAKQIHAHVLKLGVHSNETQQSLSKLFTFLALSPSRDLTYARLLLNSLPNPNSFYYNTMIRAYSQSFDPVLQECAVTLFLSMLNQPAHYTPRPDKFTYPFVSKSCARLGLIQQGKQVHALTVKSGLGSDLYIQNALIHMYSEFGESVLACVLFEKMPVRDVVSWTSMIDGLVHNNLPIEAIKLFEQMLEGRIEINDATAVSVLRACADVGALGVGRRVHEIVKEKEMSLKGNVCTALIDMYAKSGCIESATLVFNDFKNKDVYVWTAMIAGLASHGLCNEAIDLFVKMENYKVKPDEKSMTAVLSACRNAGLVSEGYRYLNNMQECYGIKATVQHYGCMVDLLSRTGCLEEAEMLINQMEIEPDAALWRTLIWACKVHGDTDRAERLMKHIALFEVNGKDTGSYVLARNVFASAGKWSDKAKVLELMNQKGLVKPPGSSKIEIQGDIHEFFMGDARHLDSEEIYAKLNEIQKRLKKERYNPKVTEVLLEISDEDKISQLLHHSEKLAFAFGLIRTSPRSEIRIVKNLRSCEDCHEFMKIMSRIYKREIIVRDRIRFHHFKNGDCSCKDYW